MKYIIDNDKYERSNKKFRKDEELKEVKPSKVYTERRRSGKLTINQALSDQSGRQRSIASLRRRQEKVKRRQVSENIEREKIIREVQVPDSITVQELANRMAERSASVVKTLMTNGIMATQNQTIDADTAILIVEEFGHTPIRISASDVEDAILKYDDSDDYKNLEERSPIITVMGHVDHGKTSLLDYIRNSSVADKEEGGITQSIGAYQVSIEDKNLTFIDTPGHAAFSKMRARGANSTDIVILVVAADDGVQPQTVEAINHAKAAGVQIVVAINKIDKPEADVDKIKGDLAKEELVADDWGRDVQMVPVSAQSGEGIPELLETIFLVSEIMDLKASFEGPATGVVLESGVKRGEGAVATLLIQQGSLNTGDFILVGDQTRKIRALKDFNDKPIKKAKPSSPVSVSGLEYPPSAGDQFYVLKDEKTAKNLSEERATKEREKRLSRMGSLNSENIFANADGTKPSINLILKSDSNGTLEALSGSVLNMKIDEVNLKIVLDGVGSITENDVNLAIASEATIFGYNVRADTTALNLSLIHI